MGPHIEDGIGEAAFIRSAQAAAGNGLPALGYTLCWARKLFSRIVLCVAIPRRLQAVNDLGFNYLRFILGALATGPASFRSICWRRIATGIRDNAGWT